MDNSLFTRIEGLSSENLTTEILKYLLESKEYCNFQKIFYFFIFGKNSMSKVDLFDIETRLFPGKGIPDVKIESEKIIIFLENKFYASFTENDQIYRYYEILKSREYLEKEKFLLLLTIHDRKQFYLKEIQEQFRKKGEIDFEKCLLRGNIHFKVLLWEDLFKRHQANNVILENLSLFIKERFLISSILTQKELDMVKSSEKEIPLSIQKIYTGVDKIRDELVSKEISCDKSSPAKDWYGFYINTDYSKLWFGCYLTAWIKFGKPYVLQVLKKEWVKKPYIWEVVLRECGFKYDKIEGFLLPFSIESNDFVSEVANTLLRIIQNIQDKQK